MRSLLGDASGGETRAMELKAGQVVRGVVTQVMDNNEAIVQINGVQVRAQLEMPMQIGQSAMLEVQPQSTGSLIVLKQMEATSAPLTDAMVKDLTKMLGLPDTKWAADLVKDLRREGFTINREAAQAFQQAAAAMPKGADPEQWMQAAAAAFKRGLPMTGAAVGALQQVMFGRAAHELLDMLQQQLAASMGGASAEGAPEAEGSAAKPLPQLAARLQALLAEGGALLRAAAEGGEPARVGGAAPTAASGAGAAGGGTATATPVQVPQGSAPSGNAALAAAAQVSDATVDSEVQGVTQNARAGASNGSSNWLGQLMKWMGVDYENQLSKQITLTDSSATAAIKSTISAAVLNGSQQADKPEQVSNSEGAVNRQSQTVQSAESRSAAPQAATTSHAPQAATVGNAQQAASAGNAQQAAATGHTQEAVAAGNAQQAASTGNAQQVQQQASGGLTGAAAAQQAVSLETTIQNDIKPFVQDSLKSVLLSIAASDDAPPALKETAQQLVQHITGQQLMLTPERNGSLFTHLTMFVPLNGADGNQTASVHIQTRRGRKGELDADNCRLLFNLSMKNLGDTMVDVNVMDKIVSLTLWNDHPAIGALAESSRAEVAESLNNAGYQLLSLRTTPIVRSSQTDESAITDKTKLPDSNSFVSSRYKGVDLRV